MRFWPYLRFPQKSSPKPPGKPKFSEASLRLPLEMPSGAHSTQGEAKHAELPPIMRFRGADFKATDSWPVDNTEEGWRKHNGSSVSIPPQSTPASIQPKSASTPKKRPPVDGVLLTASLILVVFGLLSVFSASAWEAAGNAGNSFAMAGKQTAFALLGLLLMRIASVTPLRVWQQWAPKLGIMVAVLIGLTIVVGTTANGSSRWLMLPGGIQFQPSEFAKLVGVLLMAQVLASKSRQRNWHGLFSVGLLTLMGFLVLKQPNVSMLILLLLTSGAMAFVSSRIPLWAFLISLPPIAAALWWKIQHTDYLSRRIIGWVNPWSDPQGTGYNLIQSWYAIGNGGILGRGWGQSLQKLSALPFPHTDFIFSIVCEELGLLGSAVMVVLFGVIAWRGVRIALTCGDRYGQIVAFGITFSLVIQALLNMAVAVGLLPVTGVTLPLISYGGTSLMVTLLMLGILMHCSRLKRNRF